MYQCIHIYCINTLKIFIFTSIEGVPNSRIFYYFKSNKSIKSSICKFVKTGGCVDFL